jgi:hypothetical protein
VQSAPSRHGLLPERIRCKPAHKAIILGELRTSTPFPQPKSHATRPVKRVSFSIAGACVAADGDLVREDYVLAA